LSKDIEAVARRNAGCERLISVPGIGPIISSAMVAAIGAGDVFSKGRDFAALGGSPCWLACLLWSAVACGRLASRKLWPDVL